MNIDDHDIMQALTTALSHKADMIAKSERMRIADCPRCGGSLRLLLVGRKNHIRMFCQGINADPAGPPPCMQLME